MNFDPNYISWQGVIFYLLLIAAFAAYAYHKKAFDFQQTDEEETEGSDEQH